MVKRERQQYILDRVEKEGRVLTKDLIAEFHIAEDTVRKDLQELSARGKVQRFHGGVRRIEDKPKPFKERIEEQPTVKQQLAIKTVDYILDKRVLYIDGGTTNLKLAESIPLDYSGTVITNAPAVALALCDHPAIEINLIGGDLNKTTKVITGIGAIEQIHAVNIQCCILGVSSLSVEDGITFPISDEAVLKKELINQSRQIIAIANKEKLDVTAAFYAADLSKIDILITNETDEKVLGRYRDLGIEVISESVDL